MKEWISKMLSDPSGVPDELRVVFVISMIFYQFAWAGWLFTGHPWEPMSYGGGMASVAAAFGLTARARGGT